MVQRYRQRPHAASFSASCHGSHGGGVGAADPLPVVGVGGVVTHDTVRQVNTSHLQLKVYSKRSIGGKADEGSSGADINTEVSKVFTLITHVQV